MSNIARSVFIKSVCVVAAFVSLYLTATPVIAQTCNFSLSCPDSIGVSEQLSCVVSPGNQAFNYSWSLTDGTITSGQGSPSLSASSFSAGQMVTVTVNIQGSGVSCSRKAVVNIRLEIQPRPMDKYGNIAFDDEKARLDNLAIMLQNEPGSQAYIIVYGGRRGRPGEAQYRANRLKNYLLNSRGIEDGRIVTVDGGYREEVEVELWIVPPGAPQPAPTPTLQPSDVTIINGGRTNRGRRRAARPD